VRDQDLGSVFGCSRILWLILRAESLPYILYFVRTLVLVGLLPAFMCSRVTWFLRTGMIAVYIRRGAFIRSPCTPPLRGCSNDDPPNNVGTGGSGRYGSKLYATHDLFSASVFSSLP
jgi:hypothetical protein